MSDSSLSSTSASTAPSQSGIDASCRVPMLMLFSGAAFWLLVASVAALLASMSFHKPDLFAEHPWLSYGRILPVARNALLYGFCLPAGYGLALWLSARLGRSSLAAPFIAGVATKLWNLAVFIGVFGILCGASTGYEGFEMPHYAFVIIFIASLLLGFCGLLTIHRRTEPELYPSLWFVIAALFWFPWILSTATMLLGISPLRGVAQSAVHWWYLGNLQVVVLGLFGLAAAFYFIPKLAGKDLHSRRLAMFTFFTLIIFGSWTGIQPGAPLPAWMGVLSVIAAVFSIVPVLAAVENLRRTCCFKSPDVGGKYFSFSIPFLLLAMLVGTAAAIPMVGQRLAFTLSLPGQWQFLVCGFYCLAALGGISYVFPRVAGVNWPCQGLWRVQFWLLAFGVVFLGGAYLVGGWIQGGKLAQASIPFVDVAKGALMPIRMATVGELLWALGSLCFGINVFTLLFEHLNEFFWPIVADVTTPLPASEVKP